MQINPNASAGPSVGELGVAPDRPVPAAEAQTTLELIMNELGRNGGALHAEVSRLDNILERSSGNTYPVSQDAREMVPSVGGHLGDIVMMIHAQQAMVEKLQSQVDRLSALI